jgi:hypothetical protein
MPQIQENARIKYLKLSVWTGQAHPITLSIAIHKPQKPFPFVFGSHFVNGFNSCLLSINELAIHRAGDQFPLFVNHIKTRDVSITHVLRLHTIWLIQKESRHAHPTVRGSDTSSSMPRESCTTAVVMG